MTEMYLTSCEELDIKEDSDESTTAHIGETLYEDDKDLYYNPDPSYNGIVEDEEKKQSYLQKCLEYKILYNRDKTNDYYLFFYMGALLNYMERRAGGCVTENGKKLLEQNVNEAMDKINEFVNDPDATETKLKKVGMQRDITRLCLYMTVGYVLCHLIEGMVEVNKEEKLDIPEEFVDDLDELGLRSNVLRPKFKQILDHYTQLLRGEYRKVYMDERNKGFVKPVFSSVVNQSNSRPDDIKNAVGIGKDGKILKDDYSLERYYSNPVLEEDVQTEDPVVEVEKKE